MAFPFFDVIFFPSSQLDILPNRPGILPPHRIFIPPVIVEKLTLGPEELWIEHPDTTA